MDKGLDLIVIDYIQLMQSAPGRKIENRQLEVAEISRSLKAMAKELDVPVLALVDDDQIQPLSLIHISPTFCMPSTEQLTILTSVQVKEPPL